MNGVNVHAVVEPSRLYGYLAEQIREFKPDWTLVSSEDRSQSLLETALKAQPSRVIYLAHTPQMFPFGPAGLYPGKRRTELIGQASAVDHDQPICRGLHSRMDGIRVIHMPSASLRFRAVSAMWPRRRWLCIDDECLRGKRNLNLPSTRTGAARIQFAALPGWGTTHGDRSALSALSNVNLLENRKNLDDILLRTRALLMPSLWVEGFGMAVVDAMLRGIPVLASNHSGLVEAKLGTDYLLPVQPINVLKIILTKTCCRCRWFQNKTSVPGRKALSRLVSDRALHERQSAAARDAA